MTKATRKPSTEEYMELVKTEDREGMEAFIEECFGTHEDYDDDLARSFAEEVLPLIELEIKTMMDNVTEAPAEVMEAVNSQEAAKEVKDASATDKGTDEVKVEAGAAATPAE